METDGDDWHANPEKAELDNLRDNDLKSRLATVCVSQNVKSRIEQ